MKKLAAFVEIPTGCRDTDERDPEPDGLVLGRRLFGSRSRAEAEELIAAAQRRA